MISVLLSAGAFAADQYCKHQIEQQAHPDREIWHGAIRITRYHNTGVFLSFLEGKGKLVRVLSTGAFGLLLVMACLARTKICRRGLTLLAGGGLSNQLDRYRRGYVVDYFSFRHLPKVVFNLGDIAVFLGAIMALAGFYLEE